MDGYHPVNPFETLNVVSSFPLSGGHLTGSVWSSTPVHLDPSLGSVNSRSLSWTLSLADDSGKRLWTTIKLVSGRFKSHIKSPSWWVGRSTRRMFVHNPSRSSGKISSPFKTPKNVGLYDGRTHLTATFDGKVSFPVWPGTFPLRLFFFCLPSVSIGRHRKRNTSKGYWSRSKAEEL